MRRALQLAALVVLLFPLILWAQRGGMRGMGAGRGFGRPSVAFRGGTPLRGGVAIRGGGAFGHRPRPRGFIGPRPFRHRFFFPRRTFLFLSYPYAYPYYYPPYYSGDYFDASYSAPQQAAPAYSSYDAALSAEISDLRDEVARLRDVESARAQQQQAPRTPAPPPPATLVFRDGRRLDVDNYAIVGGTLWILSEQRARKIPLAELNLDATIKTNEQRGIEFYVPPQSPAR